jgi:hypothetical protein
MTPDIKEISSLAEKVWPVVARLLRGRPPAVQGWALADLTATWLAGHAVEGDPAATYALRERFLKEHVRAIRELIPINAKLLGTELGQKQ